jgi:hypothetical protein
MKTADTSPATGLKDGTFVEITMKKDGKTLKATIDGVDEEKRFSYASRVGLGVTLRATHVLAAVSDGGTSITHSFDFDGFAGGGTLCDAVPCRCLYRFVVFILLFQVRT